MRRVIRATLNRKQADYLRARQERADAKAAAATLVPEKEWEGARQTKIMGTVVTMLQEMMGPRERCMYCVDSHGADIEHFWPKSHYPQRMFMWPNLLLCCTECGRKKGERFPLENGAPLLVDPTTEDPWEHLDFDPTTGNVVARFYAESNAYAPKGVKTVEILELDVREAMASGYAKTFRRLSAVVERSLREGTVNFPEMIAALKEEDDHGLLGWCFRGTGQNVPPFSDLRQHHEDIWTECLAAVAEI